MSQEQDCHNGLSLKIKNKLKGSSAAHIRASSTASH